MRRIFLALMVGAGALLLAVPAGAQTPPYEQPPGERPVQPRVVANVSTPTVAAGVSVTVTVTAPPAFRPGSPVEINFVRARQGAAAADLGNGTAGSNGSVSQSVTVPASEAGVYFLYITGVDADGNPVVALVAMVVKGGAQAASVEGDSFRAAAAAPASAPVPAAVAEVQSVSPDVEAAVVDAVTQGAGVALSPQGTLQVRTAAGALQDATTLPRTGTSTDISQQVTIGAALLLAGTGMVLLRRRGGFTK